MNQKTSNVLSLFDGMSCGQQALDWLRIKVDKYFASEIDKYAIQNKYTHILILDYFMDGKNGLEILKAIKGTNPKTEVITLSAIIRPSVTAL